MVNAVTNATHVYKYNQSSSYSYVADTDAGWKDFSVKSLPTPTEDYDNNFNTYNEFESGDNTGYWHVRYEHLFGCTRAVKQIKYRQYIRTVLSTGASSNQAKAWCSCQILQNGVWNELPNSYQHLDGVVGDHNYDSGTIELDTLYKCDGIRFYFCMFTQKVCNPACGGSEDAYARAYEMQAFISRVFGQII
jgi:hypothetical protein